MAHPAVGAMYDCMGLSKFAIMYLESKCLFIAYSSLYTSIILMIVSLDETFVP